MRLIITRPEDDALPLKAKLESRGHTAILAPLLKIVPRPGAYVPPLAYQFICTTSANALKFLQVEDRLKIIPLLAVGPQSLAAAEENGFKFAGAHGGDVQGLAAHVAAKFDPQKGPVLYLSGAETSADLQALLMDAGFAVERVITYDAVIQTPDDIGSAVKGADGVLLYSPRSARLWCGLIESSGLERKAAAPIYYCLSENVAKALPGSWQKRVAKTPDEAAMLALLD
jgi:uroporphyrinogen-III synthase